MQTKYRGWIPTVTGRLSFSHFGDCTLHSSKSISRTDGITRYLLVEQRRAIWDVMLPAWRIFERTLGFVGAVHFVCVGETEDIAATNEKPVDSQGILAGRVFIISDRKRWKKKVKDSFKAAVLQLDDYEAFPTTATIKEHFEQPSSQLQTILGEHCAFQCGFRIKRNGVTDILVDDTDKRAGDAPQFPTGHLQHAVTSQIYSFLRDVGHVHQHHAKSTDTIVDLYSLESDADDISWRLKTLYSIYRRVISFKRQGDIAVQIQCVGLIAYAKAFKRVWIEERPDAEKHGEIPVFYDEPMKESIQSSELRMRYKLQQAAERWSIIRTVTIGTLGVIISFVSLANSSSAPKITVPPSPALSLAVKGLLTYPLQTISFFIILIAGVVLTRSTLFRPDEWRFFRYVQALAQPYGRRSVFIGFVLAAVAIVWAAIKITW